MTSVLTSLSLPTDAPRTAVQSRDEQRLRAAKTALQTYDRQRTEAAEERKAIARKKAEDLKARIQMMKLSMPSDPEAAARVIAALARELGAAVKAYGGPSGGLEAGLAATAAPTTGETLAMEAAAVAPAPTTDTGEPTTGEAEAGPTDPYRQAAQAQQTRAAEQARRSESAKADSEFATLVKGLMAELKAMARKAEADADKAGDAAPQDLSAIDQTFRTIEGDLGAAGGALSGAMVSLTV
ncbi:hypothetical protein ACETK8_02645 [Brevundimonas staleyi]|uniref:Cell envelope biogenesis protein TolA n=1 Tax=Brevundimonas staleyi TaxID=74326 RepID=A0ABW0FU22_9CAUL